MAEPYFKVGEEVWVVSKAVPEVKEGIIYEILIMPAFSECRETGCLQGYYGDGHFGYKLEQIVIDNTGKTEIAFEESSLRKKHKPSEDSFEEMMSNLLQEHKVNDNIIV